MRSLLLWLPLLIFGALLAIFVGGLLQPDDHVVRSRMIGKPMPQFTLPPAASDRPGLSSKQLATGEPRLVNIFASWCVPCAAEAPQLMRLAQAGVKIDGIAIRDARADVDAFLKRHGNPYSRIGLDARSAVQLAMGSSGVPESFVVDGQGIIRYQHIGDIRAEDVAMIRQKLAEAAQ